MGRNRWRLREGWRDRGIEGWNRVWEGGITGEEEGGTRME